MFWTVGHRFDDMTTERPLEFAPEPSRRQRAERLSQDCSESSERISVTSKTAMLRLIARSSGVERSARL